MAVTDPEKGGASGPSPPSSRASAATATDTPKPAAPAASTPAEKSSSEQPRPDLEKADTRLSRDKRADDADNTDDLYAHLPQHEADVLRRQVATPEVRTGVLTLYRYTSRNDLLVIIVSAITAIASGAALPLMTVLFGNLQGTFQDYFMPGTDMTYDDFLDEIVKLILYFVYLAIGEFVSGPGVVGADMGLFSFGKGANGCLADLRLHLDCRLHL